MVTMNKSTSFPLLFHTAYDSAIDRHHAGLISSLTPSVGKRLNILLTVVGPNVHGTRFTGNQTDVTSRLI